jgi:hypothetical protein
MNKYSIVGAGLLLLILVVAIFGTRPFASSINAAPQLAQGYSGFETGYRRLPDGTVEVTALTRMPDVSAEMVRWWFADFLQTTEHYKMWHPQDHVWMDWENKRDGKIVGASHLVHEFIGGEMGKLRIQFVDPAEFFGADPNEAGTLAVCAHAGLLEEPLYIAKMCHVVRNMSWGAEMRSRFWMGHVSAREGDEAVGSFVGAIGNLAIVRFFTVKEEAAAGLLKHAIEEMGYLSDLLPDLYVSEHGEG